MPPPRRFLISPVLAALLTGVAACADRALVGPPPGEPADAAYADPVQRRDDVPSVIRPEEQAFADLARRVPSSAGFVLDSSGGIVVLVRDEKDEPAAVSAVRQAASADPALKGLQNVRSRRADYSFGELARWRDVVYEQIFNTVRGVSLLDLDEAANRVTIGLVSQRAVEARAEVDASLAKIGVPAEAVRFRILEYGSFLSGRDFAARRFSSLPPALTDLFPDLIGGIQITMSQSSTGVINAPCSIGFTMTYAPPGGSSYPALVTATHCSQVWGALDGTSISQPASSPGSTSVGSESRDPHKYKCGLNWCRQSDASIFQVAGRPLQVGLIARTTYASTSAAFGSLQIDQNSPYFIISQTGYIPVAAPYSKMGRTTGWTSGVKLLSCIDHHFSHPGAGAFWDLYTTTCNDVGSAQVDGGDSGGSVFARLDTNRVSLLGTTVGRMGNDPGDPHLYSPIGRIMADMGGTFNVVRPPTLATPAVTASIVGGHARLDWPAVAGATEYLVELVDYDETCGDFGFGWECHLLGYPSSVVVQSAWFQDPRSTFTSVLQSWQSGHVRTHVTVTARSPMSASFSLPSATQRFAR